MTNNHLIDKTIKLLDGYPEIKVATLFGSCIQNRLTESSDIDMGIAGDAAFAYEFINTVATELALELKKEIDIVDMQAVSGTILTQALCSGKTIKNTSPSILAKLMKNVWYYQADMKPLADRITDAHIRNFIHG